MLRLCIIGTNESISALKSKGMFCVGVSDIIEAAEKVHSLADEGYDPIYISEEFYSDIYKNASKDTYEKMLRKLPSSNSGDIGTIRSILMTRAAV